MESGRPTCFPDIASRDWCAPLAATPRLDGTSAALRSGRGNPPTVVGHLDRSEHCLDRMRTSVLAVIPLAAVRAHALTLQILDHLLRSHEVLHAVQHRLAFGYAHPQGLQGQLRPLDFHHATPLFAAIVEAHDFHSERHARLRPMKSSRCASRRLASSRWKRSGSSGPYSCSRRSMLAKPSWRIWR